MAEILVIEDNPQNRELMTYLLRAFGHRVTTAADGELALEAIRSARFDIIVCDVHLPKLDGMQIVAAVRADAERSTTPMVAVTALAMVGDRERLLSAGFDGYVSKPIDPRTFLAELDAIALRRHASTAAAAPE